MALSRTLATPKNDLSSDHRALVGAPRWAQRVPDGMCGGAGKTDRTALLGSLVGALRLPVQDGAERAVHVLERTTR